MIEDCSKPIGLVGTRVLGHALPLADTSWPKSLFDVTRNLGFHGNAKKQCARFGLKQEII